MINNIKEIIKNREQVDSQNLTRTNYLNPNNENTQNNVPKSNNQVLNKLDQEILQNYKMKLLTLETENNKISEELNSTIRNFEALCLKNKEDKNLIKKLEEELNFYKNKLKYSDSQKNEEENSQIIKNYKEKIDQLNGIIKSLESKLNNNLGNSAKFQEKEIFFKNYINKLEEKNRNINSTNESLEKDNCLFKKEISSMKKEIKSLKDELLTNNETIELNQRKLIELEELKSEFETMRNSFESAKIQLKENLEGKLKKEKDLIEKLLLESREKIKYLDSKNKEMSNCLVDKNKLLEDLFLMSNNLKQNIEDLEFNKQILEKQIKIFIEKNEDYIGQIKELNEKIHNLENSIEQLNTVKVNFDDLSNRNERDNIILNTKEILLKFQSNFNAILSTNIFSINDKIVSNLENKINNLNRVLEQKSKLESIRISDLFLEQQKSQVKINSLEYENKNKDLKLNELLLTIKTLEENINKSSQDLERSKYLAYENDKKYKSEIDKLEKKVNKKRSKNRSLQLEVEKLRKELEIVPVEKLPDMEKKIENSKEKNIEIKNLIDKQEMIILFSQITNLSEKLKLSFATLSIVITCRSCSDENSKFFINQCGHSICEKCLNSSKICVECNSLILTEKTVIENKNLNNIVTRLKFAIQINNDIDSIINHIKEKIDN